ncbi:hypothetical protein OROHE_001086 [Orobanche hederae]
MRFLGIGEVMTLDWTIWSERIQLGLIIRAATIGHTPPTNFIVVTMGITFILLVGWRALLFSIFGTGRGKQNDVYKRGSAFELYEVFAYNVGEKMVMLIVSIFEPKHGNIFSGVERKLTTVEGWKACEKVIVESMIPL